MTELETPRLKLRQWRAADLEPFASLNADPVVIEFLSRCLTRAESDEFAERVLAGRDGAARHAPRRGRGLRPSQTAGGARAPAARALPPEARGLAARLDRPGAAVAGPLRLAPSGRLAHRERDVHEVRAPHHLESERGAGRHAAQAPVERIDAVARLIVHGDDQIAGAQIRLRGRPLRLA